MKFITVKTRPLLPPKDNIYSVLDEYLPSLHEGDVILITSKVIAIHQGRCLKIEDVPDKDALIKKEADVYIPREDVPGNHVVLTVKDYTLIPTAGIDESNANGYYILWPKNANKIAKEICNYLKKKNSVKKLAVIITDSHTEPMRYGVIGVSVGFFGLEPLADHRGKTDIFGRKLKITRSNVVDALATTAVLLMGEGAEQTPIVIARGCNFVKLTNKHTYKKLVISPQEDIYYPLLERFYGRKKKK